MRGIYYRHVVANPVDESETTGFFRVDRLSSGQKMHGIGVAAGAGEAIGAVPSGDPSSTIKI